jgi:hypothetical protein
MVTKEELKQFVPINGFPKYKINRDGKIYNTEKKELLKPIQEAVGLYVDSERKCGKRRKYGNGYKRVRQPIKRLVYEHFSENLGGIDDLSKYLIKHSDGDDNIDNLYLVRKQKFEGRKKKPDCSSKYIGVHWRPDIEKWYSRIKINGMCYSLGSFNHEENAGYVYDAICRTLKPELYKNKPLLDIVLPEEHENRDQRVTELIEKIQRKK